MYVLALMVLLAACCINQSQAERLRVCYYSNWSQYRPGAGKFVPEDIDPFLCTHIMFSFAKLDPSSHQLENYEWNDKSYLYPAVNNLKSINPNLKTLLAVGGWNEASERFTTMVSDVSLREKFARTSVTFLRDHGFDGLDLDWEYPALRGGVASDKQNYVLLMRDLMAEFEAEASQTGNHRLLLSAAVPAGVKNISPGYDIPAINEVLDFINLMSYDLHGAWDSTTGHNSPLFARSDEGGDAAEFNVEFAANYWVQQGASPDKLVIGLATYGRGFRLTSTSDTGLGAQASGASTIGPYTRESGFLAYYEVCSLIPQGTRYWNDESKVPYLVAGDQWIGYDDVMSIRHKLQWIKDNNFAGAMVWNIDLDDFNGEFCGQGPYPLTGLIKTVFDDAYDPPDTTTSDPVTNGPTGGTSTNNPPITTAAPTNPPAIDCSGNVRYYPDSSDCQLYWECVHGKAHSRTCADGLYWNPDAQYCDWEANVDCNPVGTTDVPTSETPATTQAPTTQQPTTQAPSTQAPTTQAPTTQAPTTVAPTTEAPTTQAPTTQVPTTQAPTQPPVTGSTPSPSAGKVRVCYYSNWSQYRPGSGRFVPEDIDPFLCTHLMLSFAKLDPSTHQLDNYEWNDKSYLYPAVKNLKTINPNLKTLLAVGGWNEASERFTTMVSDVSLREKFARTSVTFLRDHGFDGLDLDWEYPALRGGAASDKQNYVLLMKDLMREFKAEASKSGLPRLLLTAAVPAGVKSIDPGYDIPEINSVLDFINLMSYDLHGAWDPTTGHNSPLFARSDEEGDAAQFNVEFAANYWLEKGASRDKLVIGLATYGRGFRLTSTSSTGLGAPASGASTAGTYTRESGFLAYYEVCEMIGQGTRYWDGEGKVPYLVKDDQWIGYEDVDSIRRKLIWIRDNKFAGAMVWNLDLDDFKGEFCGQGPYPLTSRIQNILGDYNPPPVTTTTPGTNGPTGSTVSTASPATTTTEATTTNSPPSDCSGNVRYYPDPSDCQLYWECVHGTAHSRTCADGLYWNPDAQYCDWEDNVDCKIEITTIPQTTPPTGQQPTTQSPTTQGKVRVCYFSNWAQWRNEPAKFLPGDIDPFLCTHIVFAFAQLDASTHELYSDWNDINRLFPAVKNLKSVNPNLKTLLAVGGWNEASERFTAMVSDVSLREKFARTSVNFLRNNGFDGLDLDWEYPALRGGAPSDKQNYVLLMKDLMSEFIAEASMSGLSRLLLTAAVPAGINNIEPGYNIPDINSVLDFINLMSYDLHGDWDSTTGHNSPLFARSDETGDARQFNVEFAANYWLDQGASRDKLVIGLPTYGRGFRLASTSNTGLGAPANGGSNSGQHTSTQGFLAYFEVCTMIAQGTRYWDDEGKVPYLVKGDQWIGYDDIESFTYKLEWIRDNNFAGAMVWNLDLDDFNGEFCGQGPYPLTGLIETVLGEYTGPPATTSTPGTDGPTTQQPTTQAPTTQVPTTQAPTTQAPTTQAPTTQAPTTQAPTTQATTTQAPTTQAPTTQASTTQAPTTRTSTTQTPTTQSPTAGSTQAPPSGKVRVCYFSNWAQWRNEPAKFLPGDIDPFLCTHIVFAFAKLDASTHELTADWTDIHRLFPEVYKLKATNPDLKTLVAVGGWNEASARFTAMVSNVSLREKFARKATIFLRDNNFDGLDLDWEYPGLKGGTVSDKQNYVLLMKDLMSEFIAEASMSGLPRLLLTAAVPAGIGNIEPGYNIPDINSVLDFINLMSYDMHGDWDSTTGHHSPLFARSDETGDARQLNVEFAATYWVEQGASPDKLVIGLPTYGRGFRLASTSNTGLGAPANGGSISGQHTWTQGFLAYFEVCTMITQGTRYWDDEGKVPYLVKGDQWIGYDDIESFTYKLEWIRDNNFAGAMVWNLDLDDFNGEFCGQGPYPLTGLIETVLGEYNGPPATTSTPGTDGPTTQPPTTQAPTTQAPTTRSPTTQAPTTQAPTTNAPTTRAPTTNAPTTQSSTTQQTTIGPLKPPETVAECKNRYTPDYTNCNRFYECVNNIRYHKECAFGLYWNNEGPYCDWEFNVDCDDILSGTTLAPPQTTSADDDDDDDLPDDPSTFCVSRSDGYYESPWDCSQYFLCGNGMTYPYYCADGLFWNSVGYCDWESMVDCGSRPKINDPTTTPSNNDVSPMKYRYDEAMAKSILFYEAQRSGRLPLDNPISWRGDSAVDDGDNGYDLSGGWYDAGDHVKFNLPMSYSSWILNWGFLKFRDAYATAGETQKMCDMIKWPLDYFLKCWIPSSNVLYVQVGNGYVDHNYWGRAENMNMGRPAFKVDYGKPGSDVAASTVAALASGYLVFKDICNDASFADRLLTASKSLYIFAMDTNGKYSDSVPEANPFYTSSGFRDEKSVAGAWMYLATNDPGYLDDAKANHDTFVPWALSWDNVKAASDVLLYEITNEQVYKSEVEAFVRAFMPGGNIPYTPCGLAFRDKWASNRYAANSALIALMAAEAGIQPEAYKTWAMSQINYMLGDNPDKRSYEIGFGDKFTQRPHHRGSSCPTTTTTCDAGAPGPNPNELTGALVGGPNQDDSYYDDRHNYENNEVACDYNAGFQGALAGLYHFALQNSLPEAPAPQC